MKSGYKMKKDAENSTLLEEARTEVLQLRQHYRNVFSASSGDIVFFDLLKRCGYFNDNLSPDDWEMIARRNFINELLELLGCADNPDKTAKAIKDSIINLAMTEKED